MVPCYNEASRMNTEAFAAFLTARSDYILCFVNDGSTDATGEVLADLCVRFPEGATHLNLPRNMGKGEAVRHGLIHLIGRGSLESVGYLDADLSTSLEEFDHLNHILSKTTHRAVFGSRVKRMGAHIDRSTGRHITGRIFATMIGSLTALPFYDTQCGAKVFAPEILEGVLDAPFISKWLFDVEIIMRLKDKFGSEISNLILEQPLREWIEMGESKIGYSDFFRIPWDLWRLRRTYRG